MIFTDRRPFRTRREICVLFQMTRAVRQINRLVLLSCTTRQKYKMPWEYISNRVHVIITFPFLCVRPHSFYFFLPGAIRGPAESELVVRCSGMPKRALFFFLIILYIYREHIVLEAARSVSVQLVSYFCVGRSGLTFGLMMPISFAK